MNTLIGIDPGRGGGIAFKIGDHPVEATPMPSTEGDLVDLLRRLVNDPAETVVFIEQVGGYVGRAQPASGAFKFGRNFGFLLGSLQTLGARVVLVSPTRWQRTLGLGSATNFTSRQDWKNSLKSSAQRLFPGLRPTLKTADALLLLEFGLRSQRPA